MKDIDFPIYKTKREGIAQVYNLNDPVQRKAYFEAKLGPQVAAIKKFLEKKLLLHF